MSTYFVVGDIHGKAQMLEELMTEWDGKAQLVFLGDLMDRGESSKRSILSLIHISEPTRH